MHSYYLLACVTQARNEEKKALKIKHSSYLTFGIDHLFLFSFTCQHWIFHGSKPYFLLKKKLDDVYVTFLSILAIFSDFHKKKKCFDPPISLRKTYTYIKIQLATLGLYQNETYFGHFNSLWNLLKKHKERTLNNKEFCK